MESLAPERLRQAGVGAFFRPRDIAPVGISFRQLQTLVADGSVDRVGHGLYRLADFVPNELETVAMVASAVPNAIVCLMSALLIHEIGTQLPHEVWIALGRKRRKPTNVPAPIRIVRFSGVMLKYGVSQESILGVPVLVTSPARTVVDCFRYRNKIGLDVALEALNDVIRSRKASTEEITRAAKSCRILTVVRPYLEAVSA